MRLKPKHLKALELLAENDARPADVAKSCGMSVAHLYALMEGKASAGPVAQEFSEEFRKEMDEINKRTEIRVKQLRDKIILKMTRWFDEVAKDAQNITEGKHKQIIDLLNALTKAAPTVSIGAISYSKGLTGEDLVNEFRRLNAIAKTVLDGGRVSGIGQAEPGLLPPSSGQGHTSPEESQARFIRA